MEAMRKEIGDHKNYKHCTPVRRRELNGKNTFMYIWSFNRKRDPDGRIIKINPACGPMESCIGVNYWETYYTVVNWMYVRYMLTLRILREVHTKLVGFFLAYTQAGVKSDINM